MNRIRRFFATMAGRLFLVLLSGMSVAAMMATLLAEAKRQQDAQRQSVLRAVDRLQGYVDLLDTSPVELRSRLLALGGPGVQQAAPDIAVLEEDAAFAAVLAAQDARFSGTRVQIVPAQYCRPRLPDFVPLPEKAQQPDAGMTQPVCRLVHARLEDGTLLPLVLDTPPMIRTSALAVDPVYLSLLAACIALLAYVVARLASQPLRQLADAADELGRNLERPALELRGPLEVRRAAQAFNAMQRRLRRHLAERTHMLAAITHDLQTPLTRMRLRLENVTEAPIRERLIADVSEMHALVREGLDLARSATTAEQPAPLDLDSLLGSIVEDAAETGGNAIFEQGCGAVLMLRPLSTHRLFTNLVDNALKYGGAARVRALVQGRYVMVSVRDEGPGIAEEDLDRVFDPFVRLETSRSRATGGVGLGLTIARALAERDGASLTLRNHVEGGLEALVSWDNPEWVADGKKVRV